MPTISDNYYSLLARIESSNNPLARAATSTASGLYQFTRSTWEGLGGTWGNRSGVAFGGQNVSIAEQRKRVEILTQQNATTLQRAGIPINNATLYAAHFLGPTGAKNVLKADPSTPITQVTSADQRNANPSVLRGTVGDFFSWLQGKTGTSVLPTLDQTTRSTNTNPGRSQSFTGASDFIQGAIAGMTTLPGIGPVVGMGSNLLTDPQGTVDAISEGASKLDPVSSIVEFFKQLFSQDTAIRLIVVIIGIAAIAAAFASLISSGSAPLQIAKGLVK